MGVDSVESSRSTKAAKNRIDKGVAGRNMLAKNSEVYRDESGSPETGSRDSALWCWATVQAVLRARLWWMRSRGGPRRYRKQARLVKRVTSEVAQDYACCTMEASERVRTLKTRD
jgi:hypothetical protein